MEYVDLHCHSTASDGTLRPAEVVRLAQQCGLSGLALTDHDTVGGIAEAAGEARRLGLAFLPGIEISAEFPKPGTLHLLGYGVDAGATPLLELTRRLVEGRDDRNPRIVRRLQELGVSIDLEEVNREAGKDQNAAAVVGRPHIAAILVRKGYASSIKQAFDKYLAPGGSAYFDKERLTSAQAIGMIHSAGGVAVLAHPVQLRLENDAQLQTAVKNLIDEGLDGIETLHSDHDAAWVARSEALAARFGLLRTGGSDFHGGNKAAIPLGTANGMRIPRTMLDALSSALRGRRVAL